VTSTALVNDMLTVWRDECTTKERGTRHMSEITPPESAAPPVLGTLAEKIEYLFAHVHPGKDRPYTLQEVVAKARDLGTATISLGFLHALRTGKSDNPTMQHLQALASVFKVPVEFFFNDDVTARVIPQLTFLALLQERGVTSIALRAADLSPAARDTLLAVIEALERQSAGSGGDGDA
jgi:transcriptional regulator with XRE-family HTH domain